MLRVRSVCWLVTVCAMLLGVGNGFAADASDADAHVKRARQLFQEQHYVEAADELQRAYVMDPKPLYLFNAGQA